MSLTRPLLLLPVPAPQLQLLFGATTAAASTLTPLTCSSSPFSSSLSTFSSTSSSSPSTSCARCQAQHAQQLGSARQCRYASSSSRLSTAASARLGPRWLPRVRGVGPKSPKSETPLPRRARPRGAAAAGSAAFGTATLSRQTLFPRHGTAVEPLDGLPELGDIKELREAGSREAPKERDKREPRQRDKMEPAVEVKPAVHANAVETPVEASGEAPLEAKPEAKPAASGPMDTILQEGPETSVLAPAPAAAHRPRPPLRQNLATPPPYVHHFDSFSLVRQLEDGGYERPQAITAMKAVRALLAHHLAIAQSNLVSKSDVENEAYLFKAACAELGVEVRNRRRRADEQTRQQRALLQHEVDIAGQSVNQELLTLNDVVRGLFNDRKMAVREEQKAAESAIQKLNYKITIMLNSETRSQLERLRWVLIRRSVLGIIFMAIVTLGSLRYASYLSHMKEREADALRLFDVKADVPDAAEFIATV